MALIRLYMTISLDGYITGPQDSLDTPMGIGGFRLFNWLDQRNDPGPSGQVYAVHKCATQARTAAGDGEVMVHGAEAAQALLCAGQLDELELHVVPVLLGQGRRLFDNLPAEHIELDLIRRLTTPQAEELTQHVTHMRYRIRHPRPGAC